MTITAEQLDELERKATIEPWNDSDLIIHLVAIARAALAWNETRKAYVAASADAEESNAALQDALAKLEAFHKAEAALEAATRSTP